MFWQIFMDVLFAAYDRGPVVSRYDGCRMPTYRGIEALARLWTGYWAATSATDPMNQLAPGLVVLAQLALLLLTIWTASPQPQRNSQCNRVNGKERRYVLRESKRIQTYKIVPKTQVAPTRMT